MKCTNCGFDAENNAVCPVCGYDLAGEAERVGFDRNFNQPTPAQPVNPYAQQQNVQPQNPYIQPQNVQPQNPYIQTQNVQPQNPYAPPQNVQPQNPYIQTQNTQPQSLYTQPPQPPAPAPNPGYNAYQPQPQTPPKRKKTNPGIIVLIAVVGAVIVIGIALAIFSSFIFSTIDSRKAAIETPAETYSDYETIEFNDKIDVSDITPHKIGESADFGELGTITLTKVEKSSEQSLYGSDYTNYKLTVVVKNSTKSEIDPQVFSADFYDADGTNLTYPVQGEEDGKAVFLYSDRDADYSDKLKPGDSRTEVTYYSVHNSVKKAYAGYSTLSMSLLGGNTERQYYEIDFSEVK